MEEEHFNFKLEMLTLEELSINAAASYFWESPDIKLQLKNFLDKYYTYQRNANAEKYLNKMSLEIAQAVLQILKPQCLPEVLKKKIEKKIWLMGEKTFDWIMHLTYDFDLDVKFTEKIYWTSTGLIDVDKIFKTFWMNLPAEFTVPQPKTQNSRKFFYEMISPLHFLACFFAQEEFLISFQEDIIKEIKSVFSFIEIGNNSDVVLDIMSTVIIFFKNFMASRSYYYANEDVINNLEERAPVKMLYICRNLRFHKAFLYFWNDLYPVEEYNYLNMVSQSCFNLLFHQVRYGKPNVFQLLVFLMDKMDASQNYKFILKNFNFIFFNFLREESLQKFCLPLINKFGSKNIFRNSNNFLSCLLNDLEHAVEISSDGHLHLQILELTMKMLTRTQKLDSYFPSYGNSLIIEMFDLFYIPFLKLIINDKDLEDHRDDAIKKGKEKYKLLIENNNIQLLNEFMDEILLSDNERNKFKQDYNFSEEFIANGQFDVVYNVLFWMHGDQAPIFKVQLNHLCCSLVPKNYDRIVKLLKWYFDTQDEPIISNCKDKSVLLKDFCRELIYNMWFRTSFMNVKDKRPTIKISTKILTFVFGSEEEIVNFKESELVRDESCVQIFCENVLKNSTPRKKEPDFSTVDRFLDFCSLPKEKIDGIKKLISENINDWIEKYGVSVGRFDIVVPLLDWIYGNKSSNCDMLKHKFENNDDVTLYYENRSIEVLKN